MYHFVLLFLYRETPVVKLSEDVGLGRSGRRVKSQYSKVPGKKNKGKNREIEKQSDFGEGNSASASLNTETDIMSQDDDMDIMSLASLLAATYWYKHSQNSSYSC